MLRAARTRRAATRSSAIIVAVTGIARSARVRRHASGWPHARPSCSPSAISTSSIRCRRRLRDVAYQNKRVIYDLLMKAAAETTLTIAADPKRLGAKIGITAVLHTWGSAMTHHPHVHMIVPGRRAIGRWQRSGSHAARTSSCTCTCSHACSAASSWRCCAGARRGAPEVLQHACAARRQQAPSRGSWRRCATSSGWSTARTHSRDHSRCCDISRATLIVSPSPIAGWSPPTTAASRSDGRTIGSMVLAAGRR